MRYEFGVLQARNKSTKMNFLGLETAGYSGGLPREGEVVEKFATSLTSLSSLGWDGRNLGCPGNVAGDVPDPWGVQKVCEKKYVRVFRSWFWQNPFLNDYPLKVARYQARQRSTNPNFWVRISSGGMGVFHVDGGRAKKFGMCLETQGNQTFGRHILTGFSPGYPGIFAKTFGQDIPGILLRRTRTLHGCHFCQDARGDFCPKSFSFKFVFNVWPLGKIRRKIGECPLNPIFGKFSYFSANFVLFSGETLN